MKRFEGKIALVTGAARGIGAAAARQLQAEGASVLGLDISPVPHCDAHLELDLSKPEKIAPELEALAQEGVEIDILVQAAALCPTHPMEDTSIGIWRKVIDINLVAAAELAKCVSKGMVARKRGAIVNVVSVSAFLPKPDQMEYGASKAALTSLTYSLAAALGPHGVRVNGIAPGIIDTALTQEIAEARAKGKSVRPEDLIDSALVNVPLRRMGTPEEVAKAICFLAGDEASYINGQILGVDGGFLMR
jgi:NAD(P)-dependent dehydrogenase (short-subunit alcohol dehydrogenase family)